MKGRNIIAGLALLVILGANISPAEVSGVNDEIVPRKDEEIVNLFHLASIRKLSLYDMSQTLRGYPKNRLLGAISYALENEQYQHEALQLMIDIHELRDRRLSKLLAKCIYTAKNKTLLQATFLARYIPDKAMIKPLVENALESEYIAGGLGGGGGYTHVHYASVFAEAAEVLYILTEGKIGSSKIRRDILTPDEKRKKMIREWKEKYKELK